MSDTGLSPPPDAVEELRTLARRLHADGMDPLDIALEVSRLNQQLGRPVRVAADIVRTLPGLERFGAMDAWRRRWADPAFVQAAVKCWQESDATSHG